MSTRCMIGKVYDGKVKAIYCHWDGYPSYTGNILETYYNNDEIIDELIELGGLSCIRPRIKPNADEEHSFTNPIDDVTIAYHRDRGEDKDIYDYNNINDFLYELRDSTSWIEYVYLWNNGAWEIYERY